MTYERPKPAQYDTSKWGAGANEREAGIMGLDDYVRFLFRLTKGVLMFPMSAAARIRRTIQYK